MSIRPGELVSVAPSDMHVVVVGDEALTALEPRDVAVWLGGRRAMVMHCPLAAPYSVVVSWALACPGRIVEPAELSGVLVEARHLWVANDVRPFLPLSAWFPVTPEPGSQAARLLGSVPLAGSLTDTADWCSDSGCSPSSLWRRCKSALGLSPMEVLALYRAAVVNAAREENASWSAIAAMTGYAHESGLRRALRVRGPRLPSLARRALEHDRRSRSERVQMREVAQQS